LRNILKSLLDIVFVTYDGLSAGDPDDLLALEILGRSGYRAGFVDWQDRVFDFAACPLVVLRSTWNYHLFVDEFETWLKRVASSTVLVNSLELVRWNLSKKYLSELERRGIDIVPTIFVDQPLDVETLDKLCSTLGDQIVVKPTLGLATYGVRTFKRTDSGSFEQAVSHIKKLCLASSAIIQPYMNAVEGRGERALVFVDGVYSHAVRKTAFQHLAVAGDAGEASVVASASEIAFGEKVLATLSEQPLYARVDVIPDADGVLRLLELELIEPSLFLSLDAQAAAKFAQAIEKKLLEHSNL
jgi:hypothetical protein